MTRYDTSAQARGSRERKRLSLIVAAVLLGLAAYILGSYLYESLTPYPPATSFAVVLGIFLVCLSAMPLFQAFLRRPHPDAVEVRDDGLVLRFAKGPPLRSSWETCPVPLAYDTRGVQGRKRRPDGMEVQMYVTVPHPDGGEPALRPVEVDVSAKAFDEVRERQKGAGFRERSRRWSRGRPGDLVEFLREGEGENDLPWPEPRSPYGRLGAGGIGAGSGSQEK
jgi:hypothetical protein